VLTPLLASGEPHGVLVMASRGSRPPSDLLWSSRILGSQLGQAVALARSLTKLAESEQHFRELAETVREVFFIAAPDLQAMIYLSPAF
jgi:GAF domain-containing protein